MISFISVRVLEVVNVFIRVVLNIISHMDGFQPLYDNPGICEHETVVEYETVLNMKLNVFDCCLQITLFDR